MLVPRLRQAWSADETPNRLHGVNRPTWYWPVPFFDGAVASHFIGNLAICFSKTVDSVSLSFAQFLFTGVISSVCMFAFETPSMPDIISVAPSLLYAGIMSSGVAFTFQILGQKRTEPAVASLLLSLESVFSVLFGWLLLKQALGARELIGCAIVFAAIVLAQLPNKRRS